MIEYDSDESQLLFIEAPRKRWWHRLMFWRQKPPVPDIILRDNLVFGDHRVRLELKAGTSRVILPPKELPKDAQW